MSYGENLAAQKSESPLSIIYKSMSLAGDFLSTLPDVVVTTNVDFIITGVNNACAIIYGGASTDLIGRNFFEVVKFEIPQASKEGAIEILKTSGYWGGDVIYYNSDQQYYNNQHTLVFNSSCSSVKDAAGNTTGYVFVNKNISERLQQQEALNKAEVKYHTLIESLSEGVVMINVNGSIAASNKRGAEILGFTPEELSGKVIASQHWQAIHEDGTEFKLEDFPAIVTLNTGREQNNVVMGIAKKEGGVAWLSINSRPFFREGFTLPEGVVASFTEITESIKSKQRYTYALKASSDAIWDMDMDTGSTYRSDNFTKLTGYTSDEIEPSLDWFMQKIHPDDRERIKENVAYCLSKKLTHWENEYRFKTADGSYLHLMDKAFAIYEKGKAARVIGGIQDMSKSKKMEAMLIYEQVQKQKMVNKATIQAQEKERNRISRELHDNVNQLLMSAKLHIGAAKKSEEENTDLLEKASAYILMAVEEIRGLSKQLNSNIIATVGLQKSIDDIARNMHLINEVVLASNIDAMLVKKLSADQLLMVFRIIQEQTNNIIKYSRCTKASVSLMEKGEEAILCISDNGQGFDKQNQPATGIGFINIFNRIDAYNGRVEINTSPGNGCTLRASFPVK